MAIDISKLFEICQTQVEQTIKSKSISKEEAFKIVYDIIVADFLKLLIREYEQEFKANFKLFAEQSSIAFPDIDEDIIDDIINSYTVNSELFKDEINNLVYLQKHKNNLIVFTEEMKCDLAKDNINQFIAFYNTLDSDDIRICSKITNWIQMMGYLEMLKLKVYGGHEIK